MKENLNDETYASYPARVECLNIGWILNEEYDINFLRTIELSNDIDLYDIPTLQMLITYLY